jgi:hypothetical protein
VRGRYAGCVRSVSRTRNKALRLWQHRGWRISNLPAPFSGLAAWRHPGGRYGRIVFPRQHRRRTSWASVSRLLPALLPLIFPVSSSLSALLIDTSLGSGPQATEIATNKRLGDRMVRRTLGQDARTAASTLFVYGVGKRGCCRVLLRPSASDTARTDLPLQVLQSTTSRTSSRNEKWYHHVRRRIGLGK